MQYDMFYTCHTCYKELTESNMAYEYCSWRCFVNRSSSVMITHKEMVKTLLDCFPNDVVYVINKYIPDTTRCLRCRTIYDRNDKRCAGSYCSDACFFNVEEHQLNVCLVCRDIFVNNGWGYHICSRRCDRIVDGL